MMLTRMLDVKANFKYKYNNLECDISNVEDNTQPLFSWKKYQDLNENIKGERLKKILKDNE